MRFSIVVSVGAACVLGGCSSEDLPSPSALDGQPAGGLSVDGSATAPPRPPLSSIADASTSAHDASTETTGAGSGADAEPADGPPSGDLGASPVDGTVPEASADLQAACKRMVAGAQAFLEALSPTEREVATMPFSDPTRTKIDWSEHAVQPGLRFRDLTQKQQGLADAFLETGLSRSGWLQFKTIMHLQDPLAVLKKNPQIYHRMHYHYLVFGTPSTTAPWGWRVQGHNVSLNFTVPGCDRGVVATPSFWGAYPAIVPSGYTGTPRPGTEPMRQEDNLPRELFLSLDPEKKSKATVDDLVDIVTAVVAMPLAPAGLLAAEMTAEQKMKLVEIVDLYLDKMVASVASDRRTSLMAAGIDKIGFLWSGSSQKGQDHAFRIQGPTFMIQFQSKESGNHIHSMWRDFDRDFGRDLVR